MARSRTAIVAGVALCVGLALAPFAGTSWAQAGPAPAVTTLKGTVQSVDQITRIVAIKGEQGLVTLEVPESVTQLVSVKAGDVVTVTYADKVAVRLKPAGEPAVDTTDPQTGQRTATVTVTAVDAAARTVSFAGPKGAQYTRRLADTADPQVLTTVKAGDRLDVTWNGAVQVAKAAPAPPPPGWQIDSKDGSAFVKFGFLAQPQAEWLETPSESDWSQNLFLRRMRILMGGKVANKWLFFIETDSPNLGKANPDKAANPSGAKDAGDVFIQDAYFTYDAMGAFKVDAGMILMPMSHNHLQSAASLLPVDYGPYTFLESGPMAERVGRDYGVQLRGYPLKQRIEYRVGVFQGVRGVEAGNPLRVIGRVAVNFLSADTGFFYLGTAQGTRQILTVGAFVDDQKDYRSTGVDGFMELNVKKLFGVTGQFNWMRFDGGDLLKTLPKQDTVLLEAGVHLARYFTPFVQYAARDFDNATLKDQDTFQAGLAWWWKGHNRNIKVGFGRQHTDGGPDRKQVQVQMQVFYY